MKLYAKVLAVLIIITVPLTTLYGLITWDLVLADDLRVSFHSVEEEKDSTSLDIPSEIDISTNFGYKLVCRSLKCYRIYIKRIIQKMLLNSEEVIKWQGIASEYLVNVHQGDAKGAPWWNTPPMPHYFHQTGKTEPTSSSYFQSWRNLNCLGDEDTRWGSCFFYDDNQAQEYVESKFPGPISELYNSLPKPILKADVFRYLILLGLGGVYSDLDTANLKPIKVWGVSGENEESAKSILGVHPGGPRFIAGIESDFRDPIPEKWFHSFPRPLQIVQWTIASAPGHPILWDLIWRIQNFSSDIVQNNITTIDPNMILSWTGPAVFTDCVITFTRARYGLNWTSLRDLKKPLWTEYNIDPNYAAIPGETIILPMTAFSPGIAAPDNRNDGHSASGSMYDVQALSRHYFDGSWRKG